MDSSSEGSDVSGDALNEDELEQQVGPSKYVFLKITLKK